MFEPEVFRKKCRIEESACDILGLFGASCSHCRGLFGDPRSDSAPGCCAPLPPSLRLCLVELSEWKKTKPQGCGAGAPKLGIFPGTGDQIKNQETEPGPELSLKFRTGAGAMAI